MPKFSDIVHGVADVLRASQGKTKYKPTSAVIVAAGESARMGGIDKQLVDICGMPALAHTVKAFESCPAIGEIVIVTRAESVERIKELCREHGFSKVKDVVVGGADRQASVWNGFLKIDDRAEFVAIHDGARCLITPEQIEKIVLEAYRCGAATAAARATDTVKLAEKGAYISDTCDRNKVWLAQTPQVFGTNLYRAAAYTAQEAKFKATDDCMLAERIKYNSVALVDCGKYNLKLTTPEDITVVEALMAARKRDQK